MTGKLHEKTRRGRRLWTAAAVLVAAMTFVAGSSANLAPSTFEGNDGNLVTNGGTDWASFPVDCATHTGCSVDVASGASDNSFGQGTAEDDPNVTVVDGSIPPNKNDLTRSYIASEVTGGNTYLYLAWERLVNTGSANIDFELNQQATPGFTGALGAVTINRTAGDILIAYDFGGSGTPTISLLRWVASGAGSQCDKSNSTPCWGKRVDLTAGGFAEAAVNGAAVSDPFLSNTAGNVATGLFGEAALNLSSPELHVFDTGTCRAFGSMFVKSRASGSSIDAELKDFIAPVPIHVSNCGSIELKKHWAGTAGSATLNIGTSSGGSQTASTSVSGADGTTGAKEVDNGTYYVSETFDSALYDKSLACTDNGGAVTPGANDSLAVSAGHQVVCTYTNTRKTGTIKLAKHWVGTPGNATLAVGSAGSGSANVATGTANGADGDTGTHTVDTGTYYVSEAYDSTLYTTSLACTDNGSAVTPGANDSVTVGAGHQVVCTYTNTRKTGTLEVKKALVPANDAGKFDLTIDGTSYTNGGAGFGNNGTTGQITVDTGSNHGVSEAGHGATTLADYVSSYSCSTGASGNGTSVTGITVNAGDHVVCTFTNSRKPHLTLVKSVVNDNGGTAAAADWLLSATGAGNDPNSFSGQGGAGPHDVTAGVAYALAESAGPAGYTAGAWQCTGGTQSGSSITLAAGQNATCTIVNDDDGPQLHLRKQVVNDNGGSAAAADWTLTATGTGGSPTNLSGSTPVDSGSSFKADMYTLAESGGPSGYTAGAWQCSGGTLNGNAVTVGLGQDVTCTVVNNDDGPALHLRKQVVNDDGGTAAPADWTLTATKDGAQSPALSGSTPVDSNASFEAGTYTLGEQDGPAHYTAGAWSCVLTGTETPVAVEDGQVEVGLGADVTCTIVNDDDAPTVTVEKRLLPANDTGTFDFTLTQGESKSVLDGGGKGYGNNGSTGQVDVSAGDLTIDESGHGSTDASQYASSWSCSSDRERSASGVGTSIPLTAISLGENVTCTFTNTRLATLVVKKLVDNSNGGGSKAPADFTIHVTTGGLDLPGSPQPGSSTGTSYTLLLPGTYRVSEDAVAGYSLTSIQGCLADGSVTLGAGQTATCTLTNTSAALPPPPPPPPPAPKVDIQITKSATPNPATVGKQVTWTMVVTNNGPNNATGVTMADPVPAGMTFVSVATSQGTCTGGALVSCQIGNLNVGSSATITLVTTAVATGAITNTATTVAQEQETNTANNTASATVTVEGAFVPPVLYCTAVSVAPKSLFVGRTHTMTMKVTQHGKAKAGVRVRVKGSTLRLTTKPSNRKGIIKQRVKPMKAGIVVFQPVATKRCNNPKVGVIGVFTPPVTG